MSPLLSEQKKSASRAEKFVVLEPSHQTSQFGGLLILSVIAAATGLLVLLAPNLPWSIRLLLIAIVLLTLRFWGAFAVLIAVQLDLLLREPPRSSTFQGPVGMLTVFLIIALLMFINRNRELLKRAASRPLSVIWARIVAAVKGEPTFEPARAIREIPRMLGGLIRGGAILTSCVFGSRILLNMLPGRRTLSKDLQQWFLEDASVARSSLLLVLVAAAWIVCNEISWRQLTHDQARLYLRSVFLVIHHADLRMVVRRGIKLRSRAARTRKDLTVAPGPVEPKT
ncbi:MAG TPA: hypothetical protein PLY87_08655 [Planctomycetaceae bacterium]|nr:hypothetical protein [Planctomycetaceae bacterium]HQZ65131.1 hypothetical protein [Planctomycetaceae bacterium]HRA87613.1 hypothetical protein [Planctomycetaceae bacterium]